MAPAFAASLLLVCLLNFVLEIKCIPPAPQCIPSEKESLTEFKSKLEDPFQHLASWDDGSDCCQWEGITCDNNTGNVIELDIHSPCSIDIISNSFDLPMDGLDAREYGCWNLSGQLDPVLAQLKHLRYIDLSLNIFGGLPIPTFLGRMKELRYLNLSSAGFSGSVPNQLGNLSNIQVLDISSIFHGPLVSADLSWMKTMSSLKHLEMNFLDLSTVSGDWIHIFIDLPNLENFYARSCDIQNIDPNPLLANFTSLRVLDLSFSNLPGASLLQWLTNLTALEFLDLSSSIDEYQGKFSHTLSELPNLQEFILTSCHLDKNVSEVFSGSWKKLRRVDLSVNYIYGELPNSLGNISSLEEIVMGSNRIAGYISEKSIRNLKYLALPDNSVRYIQVGNLTSLEHLELPRNDVNFLQGDLRSLIHLKYLDLSENKLTSSIPKELGLLSSLEHLDLSNNNIIGAIPLEIGNLTSLKTMDFSHNMIQGVIPKELGRMARLINLDLSDNKLYGSVPKEIGNLVKLADMNLMDNELSGGLPRDIGKLTNLQQMDLLGNKFNEVKLEWLCPLRKLSTLDLRDFNLTGPIPPCLGSMSSLTTLALSGNKLNGTVPSTIGQLSKLDILDLSSNNLHGPISEAHFQNMSKLNRLDLSSNFLKFQFPQNWVPSFQLFEANFRSCHIGPAFPSWLRTQYNIGSLDLSNTFIADKIPPWFWNITTNSDNLNLSDNKIGGHLPNRFPSFPPSFVLDLSNNFISGNIPRFSAGISILDISDNLVDGSIPEDICNITDAFGCIDVFLAARNKINGYIPSAFGEFESISVIDLSSNSLSGKIPINLGKIRELMVLDLSRNQLSGKLEWPLVLLENLKSFHLEKNMITGRLPSSLSNCTSIEVFDIGENKFHGNIPSWIGARFTALQILRLRNNSFTGQIPSTLSTLESLHVLDLAENSLSGQIPKTLGDLRSMKQVNKTSEDWTYGGYYRENIFVSMKGQTLEYSRTLSLVASIDLSFNNLSGLIPSELGDLSGLLALNLSHNRLSGSILNNIGHLNQLFSLDLSWNELSGEIPPSISNLTFLSKLNMSYNELFGRIPTGQQLQTLNDPSIYVGNSQLCGQQISRKCPGDHPQKSPIQPISKISKDEDNSRMWFFYVSLGLGFVSGFWVFYGVLILKNAWRLAFFRGFDSMSVWLYVKFTLMKAKLQRKMQIG